MREDLKAIPPLEGIRPGGWNPTPNPSVQRFIRVEDHSVPSVTIAGEKIIRRLHKSGKCGMLETIADIIEDDPMNSETRALCASWLRIIAPKI